MVTEYFVQSRSARPSYQGVLLALLRVALNGRGNDRSRSVFYNFVVARHRLRPVDSLLMVAAGRVSDSKVTVLLQSPVAVSPLITVRFSAMSTLVTPRVQALLVAVLLTLCLVLPTPPCLAVMGPDRVVSVVRRVSNVVANVAGAGAPFIAKTVLLPFVTGTPSPLRS